MKNDLEQLMKVYLERSLSYELQRHFRLRYSIAILLNVTVYSRMKYSPIMSDAETIIEATVLDYRCTDPKDSFIMDLHDRGKVLDWLSERAELSVRGMAKRLDYYYETQGLNPEEALRELTGHIPR